MTSPTTRPTRVLYCGKGWPALVDHLRAALAELLVEADVRFRDHDRPLKEQLSDVDVVLPSNSILGSAELASAPRLRLVQQPAVGHETIDLAAARAARVPVCNAPATNSDAVAQAALLLVLALARRLPLARRAFERAEVGVPVGVELGGKTICIVGVGRTGSRLAEYAHALGMRVVGVRSVDGRARMLELLAESDVVSIHCPLTPLTHRSFDDDAFAAMKPGAFLVNVARGAIVDREALEHALDHGKLGGVGLDVFWEEPWDPNDPLFARENVVTLPHVGGTTTEALTRIARVCARNVRAIVDGEELAHRIA
jgi:phosphoglycerate dehydrogenase-like enzyme